MNTVSSALMLSAAIAATGMQANRDAAPTPPPEPSPRPTDRFCGLNGIYSETTSTCKCFKGWKGRTCAELNLAQASMATYGLHNKSNPTWGGSVFFEDGVWQMIVGARAVQLANNSIDNYQCNSHIIRAETEGQDPAGPWAIADVIFPRITWEPMLTRMPDGGLLMLFFGNLSASKPAIGSPACFVNSNYLTNMTTYASVSKSGSVKGPWSEPIMVKGMENKNGRNITIAGRGTVPKLSCDWYCANGNPGPAYHPNGTLFAVMRSDTCDQTCQKREHVGLWRADQGWDGEWTLVLDKPLFGWGGTEETCDTRWATCPRNEDPHLWIDGEGGFHLLVHSQNAENGLHRGAYGWSTDGLDWVLETLPLDQNVSAWSPNVTWTNGTETFVYRRQRPSLVRDPNTGHPTHLVNGADFISRENHHDPPPPWCEGCHWGTGMTLIQPVAE